MIYKIQYTPAAAKQLSKLDKPVAKSILDYMKSIAENPTSFGKALRKELKGYWRHRVGDYRVISSIEQDKLIVLVVRIGHRREIYS